MEEPILVSKFYDPILLPTENTAGAVFVKDSVRFKCQGQRSFRRVNWELRTLFCHKRLVPQIRRLQDASSVAWVFEPHILFDLMSVLDETLLNSAATMRTSHGVTTRPCLGEQRQCGGRVIIRT